MTEYKHSRQPVLIGVTGHRILADVARIEAGIAEALRRITQAYPGRPLTVLSSLAEGADRLVARQTLQQPDTQLIVPLPLPPNDYRSDFSTPESRAEFDTLLAGAYAVIPPPKAESREAAYAAAGRYVADLCDVLLAIWDGRTAQGKGGTAEMVEYARSLGKPLVIVRAGNRKSGTQEPTTLGEEQGRVVTERLTVQEPGS